MGTIFIILGAVAVIVGFCPMIAGLVDGFNTRMVWICLISLGGGSISILFGSTIAVTNWFYEQVEKIREALSNLNVYKRQQKDLREKLIDLLEKYLGHEAKLIDAVKDRTTDNLLALMEKYPDLKASVNVTDLIAKIQSLRKEIVGAEKGHNKYVREYNAMEKQIPSRWMKPSDLTEIQVYLKDEDTN